MSKWIFILLTSLCTLRADVCDLDQIYSEQFSYSLPRPIMESFLNGKSFDNPTFYSEEELTALKDDIRDLYQEILSKSPIKEKIAILTAGAPGSGKTTLMKQWLKREPRPFAYICPDDVALPNQKRTFAVSNLPAEEAYNKWRPGSNAVAHLILANLIRDQRAFYFGTTSTGAGTPKFFEFLKKQGYRIVLLHLTAPDEVRWEAVRNHELLHTTREDVYEKGLLFPQRISDCYLKWADEIHFYYRDKFENDAVDTAFWSRECTELQIFNPEDYASIKSIHNTMCDQLNRKNLRWENTVENYSK